MAAAAAGAKDVKYGALEYKNGVYCPSESDAQETSGPGSDIHAMCSGCALCLCLCCCSLLCCAVCCCNAVGTTAMLMMCVNDGVGCDGCRAWQVALGIFKSVVGAASFAIPWGFQEAGIVAATIITVIIGFLSYETMRILVASKQTVVKDYGRSLDYAGIVALVLGDSWEIVIKAATTISCLGACTGYLIFMSTLGAEVSALWLFESCDCSLSH